MRIVLPHDLELFAINTGALYEEHKSLARMNAPLSSWISHVDRVLIRYSREVEPVTAPTKTIADVARALSAYYRNHVKEL